MPPRIPSDNPAKRPEIEPHEPNTGDGGELSLRDISRELGELRDFLQTTEAKAAERYAAGVRQGALLVRASTRDPAIGSWFLFGLGLVLTVFAVIGAIPANLLISAEYVVTLIAGVLLLIVGGFVMIAIGFLTTKAGQVAMKSYPV